MLRAFIRSCAGHTRQARPDALHDAQMLEPIFGWEDIFKSRPKLGAYYAAVQADPVGARVRAPTHENGFRVSGRPGRHAGAAAVACTEGALDRMHEPMACRAFNAHNVSL